MPSATADVEVEVPSPLPECILYCEVECVRDCCGIDAVSTDAKLVADWCREVGSVAAAQALCQVRTLLALVEDRTRKVSSLFLNHYTYDEAARGKLLSFLLAFESVLERRAETGPVADQPHE